MYFAAIVVLGMYTLRLLVASSTIGYGNVDGSMIPLKRSGLSACLWMAICETHRQQIAAHLRPGQSQRTLAQKPMKSKMLHMNSASASKFTGIESMLWRRHQLRVKASEAVSNVKHEHTI